MKIKATGVKIKATGDAKLNDSPDNNTTINEVIRNFYKQ